MESVETWIEEALRYVGKEGASLSQIQRFIDEHHYEELAKDTLQRGLNKLISKQRVKEVMGNYVLERPQNSKAAFDNLFKDS